MNRDEQIEAGAQALANAFPTLTEDFLNPEWFRKAARIVLEAAQDDENR